MSLQQYFAEQFTSDDLNMFLKLCASVLGKREQPTRKIERVQLLVSTLQDPQSVRQLWMALDELARKAVAAAYHNEGEFHADAFVAQYGALPPRPKSSSWHYYPEPILLDLFIQQGRIPPELMPLLAKLVPPPERFQVRGAQRLDPVIDLGGGEQIELRIVETEQTGWHDLLLLLQLVDQRALKFGAAGEKLAPDSLPALLDQLLQGDFLSPADLASEWERPKAVRAASGKADARRKVDDTIRPFGLTVFARGAGLIETDGLARLTDRGRDFLKNQDPDSLLEAFETWTKRSAFDEITRIEAIKGFKSRGLQLTSPAMRRERIVEALSWCPAGLWIDIAEFYRGLKVWRFDFEIEQGGIEKLYVGNRYRSDAYYEAWAAESDMWLLINGLYIKAVLWEYLASIGALDLAYLPPGEVSIEATPYFDYDGPYYSRYDGLLCFRINPLGAYLFGQAGEYTAVRIEAAPLLRLDAGRLVTVTDPARLTPMLKAQLEQFAAPETEFAFRLDTERLLLTLEQGADLEATRDFLARNSGGALPVEVKRWLDEMRDASEAFTVDKPMLRIRAASEELVQMVLADAELGKFSQALGNRALLIPASRQSRFRSRLRQLGYGLREK